MPMDHTDGLYKKELEKPESSLFEYLVGGIIL